MASQYYYLIASLPYLSLGGKEFISSGEFAAECGKWLAPNDLKVLEKIDAKNTGDKEIEPDTDDVVEQWKTFKQNLEEGLDAVRLAKRSPAKVRVPEMLTAVFEQGTPLAMEKSIERLKWDFAEQRESWYQFDISWLFLYLLKVRVLERLASFDRRKGEEAFQRLCEVDYDRE